MQNKIRVFQNRQLVRQVVYENDAILLIDCQPMPGKLLEFTKMFIDGHLHKIDIYEDGTKTASVEIDETNMMLYEIKAEPGAYAVAWLNKEDHVLWKP